MQTTLDRPTTTYRTTSALRAYARAGCPGVTARPAGAATTNVRGTTGPLPPQGTTSQPLPHATDPAATRSAVGVLAPVVLLVVAVLVGWAVLGAWVPVVSVIACLGGGLAVVAVVLAAGFREHHEKRSHG